jgi:PAS domain-containing protein
MTAATDYLNAAVVTVGYGIVVHRLFGLFNKHFRKPAIVIDTDTTNNNNNNDNNDNKIDDILSTCEKKVVVKSPTNTGSSYNKHRRNKSDVPSPTAMLGGGCEDDVFGMNSSSTHIQRSNSGNSAHRRIHSEMPPQRRSQSGYLTDNVQDFPDLIDSNLEPHYSNLIDSANAPIFGVDSVGRVNVWNKCAMRIVGYTKDEVMGKNLVTEFITKDYQASVGMVIDRALR